jgi:two-component system NtrC family sensor kinase
MNILRNLLIAIVALGLVGTLVFFYNKTQAIDLGKSNEVVALLRQLQSIDNQWDIDVLRARIELEDSTVGTPDRAAVAKRTLKTLAQDMPDAHSPALNAGFDKISTAITEKAALVKQYLEANSQTKSDLRTVLAVASQPATTAGGRTDPRSREFRQVLNTLSAAALQYYWYGQDDQFNIIETGTANMLALVARLGDSTLSSQSDQMDIALRSLVKDRPAEQKLFERVSLLTAGPRLESLTLAYDHELELTLQDKERFRIYMIAYAAALLISVAYLGVRLEAARERLEQRVAARTHELSEALQHLKESEAQLVQSEKMSSLGQMVAGVAHEINTPLAYVSNTINTVNSRLPQINTVVDGSEKLLQLLRDHNADPEELNRQFELLSGQIDELKLHGVLQELAGLVQDGIYGTDQVKEIVGNLKDFSRLDRSKVSSFNLNDGLDSTLGLARHLLKSIKVSKDYGIIPSVTCAPSQINQVFLNLITNAAQALPEQGGEIKLSTRQEDNGVAVEVADNGSGIPPEVLPKIFDPFYTTKDVGKGTGLGLSISYKIIQEHGGRIDVKSEVGKGTRFTVWLPLQSSEENRQSA